MGVLHKSTNSRTILPTKKKQGKVLDFNQLIETYSKLQQHFEQKDGQRTPQVFTEVAMCISFENVLTNDNDHIEQPVLGA